MSAIENFIWETAKADLAEVVIVHNPYVAPFQREGCDSAAMSSFPMSRFALLEDMEFLLTTLDVKFLTSH